MNRKRILLAEDHPATCDAIASLLSREHEVVGIVNRGDEVLGVAAQLIPEVIVLDVSMPGRSGLQVLPELRIQMPLAVIIILTLHSEPIYMEEAFSRGADEYVLKNRCVTELLPVINAALIRREGASTSIPGEPNIRFM